MKLLDKVGLSIFFWIAFKGNWLPMVARLKLAHWVVKGLCSKRTQQALFLYLTVLAQNDFDRVKTLAFFSNQPQPVVANNGVSKPNNVLQFRKKDKDSKETF